jgi:hypothetical protein
MAKRTKGRRLAQGAGLQHFETFWLVWVVTRTKSIPYAMRTACVLSSLWGARDAGHKEGSERTFLTNSTVISFSLFLSIHLQHIILFLLHIYKKWDSSDSVVTRPSAGQPRNCGAIHGMRNTMFTSPKRPNRFSGPMNLPQGTLTTELPQPGCAADYPTLSNCEIKVCAAVPPLPHVFTARCLISA